MESREIFLRQKEATHKRMVEILGMVRPEHMDWRPEKRTRVCSASSLRWLRVAFCGSAVKGRGPTSRPRPVLRCFPELSRLFEKTAGLIPALRQVLQRFEDKVTCAFVYGSLARGEEHAVSDIDLMVIGTLGLAGLSPALRHVESRLGREVNVTSYSVAEFREKVAANDHFLATVLRSSKQFVKGRQRDLDEIIG